MHSGPPWTRCGLPQINLSSRWLVFTRPDLAGFARPATISSLDGQDIPVMLGYVRGHREIENKLHWSLDVTSREDDLRNRVGHSAENFPRIRRLVLNVLRRDKTCKAGIKGKRLQACLKEEYLLRVISQGV